MPDSNRFLTIASSTTTADTTSASSIVISFPELMLLIAQSLQPRDLRFCILVSRHWYQFISPLLWRTIDTRVRPWLKTFREHDYLGDDHHKPQQRDPQYTLQQQRKREEISEWVKGLVARYGQHVRCLSVNWNIVLEAASFNQECRNLSELVVGNVAYHRAMYPLTVDIVAAGLPTPPVTIVQKLTTTSTTTATTTTDTTTTDTTTMTTMATTADEEMTVVQWLHLPWASNRKIYVPEEVNEELRRKITIERFWALVHQNPGLVRLSFPNLGAMNDLSKDYIFQSLISLKHLRDLDLSLTLLNPRTVLTSLPNLHRLQIYNLDGLLTTPLQEQFPGLHSLGLRTYVPISQVLKVLDHLPSLENLWIKGILSEPLPRLTANITASSPTHKLSLKTLHVDETLARDDEYIALFVSQCPGLVRIRGMMGELTVKALWEGCFWLDEMKSTIKDVEDWRQRRKKMGDGKKEM